MARLQKGTQKFGNITNLGTVEIKSKVKTMLLSVKVSRTLRIMSTKSLDFEV